MFGIISKLASTTLDCKFNAPSNANYSHRCNDGGFILFKKIILLFIKRMLYSNSKLINKKEQNL